MKKITKLLLLSFLMLILVPNKFVQAATNQQINFGTTITGTISEDKSNDTYKITLPKSGKIDLQLNAYINRLYVEVFDTNNNSVGYTTLYNGSQDNPEKWSFSENLEAGTYYIKIEKLYGYTGKYDFKVNYTEVNTNDVEPNNGTVTAQKINLNSNPIKGYITWNEPSDYYKFDMQKPGKINLQLNSYVGRLFVEVLDSNNNSVGYTTLYNGSEDNPEKWNFSQNLDAGTYYIKFEKLYGHTGKYDFKVNYTEVNTNDIEPNNGTVTAQKINLNSNPIKGYITWNDSSDFYKFNVENEGKINLQLNSFLERLYVEILDSNNNTIDYKTFYNGSENTPETWNLSKKFKPGTYYIKVEKLYGYTGLYTFNIGNNCGWVQNANRSWSYYDTQTSELKTGWFQDGSTWYYSNSNGIMQTGWLNQGNVWYFLGSNGAMRTGWASDGQSWYFLNSNGTMRTGWLNDGQSWYFLNSNGTMKTGWLQLGNKWYYMYSNGVMACNTTINGCRLGSNGEWI